MKKIYSTADIVIIGAGSAGCILMSELSKNFSVIGLEAGSNFTTDPAITAVGSPAQQLQESSQYKYFWQGFQQTQPMAGLNGRVGDWTTGMLLGGDSSVNDLYYGRGSNAVYSQWAGIAGRPRWNLDNILQTFNDLENYQGLTDIPNSRGTNGLVSVLQTPNVSQMARDVVLQALGLATPEISVTIDYNDPSSESCIDARAQWFVDPTGSTRVSSATSFLNSSVMTPKGYGVGNHKLKIIFKAVVTKIIFDNIKNKNKNKHGNKKKKSKARKVEYIKDGQLHQVTARKAVIITAGFNSSKILQLSGIGSALTLANAGIKPVFINENVGKHLKNHPSISITLLADPNDIGTVSGAPYAYYITNAYLPAIGGSSNDPRMVQLLFEIF